MHTSTHMPAHNYACTLTLTYKCMHTNRPVYSLWASLPFGQMGICLTQDWQKEKKGEKREREETKKEKRKKKKKEERTKNKKKRRRVRECGMCAVFSCCHTAGTIASYARFDHVQHSLKECCDSNIGMCFVCLLNRYSVRAGCGDLDEFACSDCPQSSDLCQR